MNDTYPSSHPDFDRNFLLLLLKAVFTKTELKDFARAESLRSFDSFKLKLVKGIFNYIEYDM